MEEFDSNELIVDSEVIAPAPLDPAIASLLLTTRSNRVTEGYDLSVSAYFGSEKIRLSGSDFSVTVEISIQKAQIDLEFLHCTTSLNKLNKEDISAERKIVEKQSTKRRKSGRGLIFVEGQYSSSLKGSGVAELEHEATNSNDAELDISRELKNWEMLSARSIMVGTVSNPLSGREIVDLEAWRVIPNSNSQRSGVVGILSVRENWINIVEIDTDSFGGRIGKKAKNLFRSKDKRKQELFDVLLQHLSAIGLSTKKHPGQAILAIEPFVVRPDIEHATSGNSASSTGNVHLDSLQIERFLESPPGREVETLVAMGVDHRTIRDQIKVRLPNRRLFLGMASVHNVLKAYRIVCRSEKINRSELEKMADGRVVADLKNLGLIQVKKGIVTPTAVDAKNPDDIFRFALSQAEAIVTTRSILIENPSASGREVGEMLVTKFGNKYNDDSKIRVGNGLIRWTTWLEPHLVDPSSANSVRLKATALETEYAVGRRSLATPENVALAKEGIAAGESNVQIAKRIGVSSQTIYRWKNNGKLD